MEKSPILVPAMLAFVVASSGCASIVSESIYPVMIDSFPPGKSFVVKNEDGEKVITGKTPQTIPLEAGDGFFDGATYKVEFAAGNTLTIDSSIDPWYFGNAIFGGLIGLVIVDPATGAMWELPESVSAIIYEETPRRTVPERATPKKQQAPTKRPSSTKRRSR